MKRFAIIIAVLLVILVAVLAVIPSFIDLGKYQDTVRQQVLEQTGYDVAVNGSIKISFLPRPHVVVTDAAVKKAQPANSPVFATVKELNVAIALLPLLSKQVELPSITLEDPVINLITARDGTNNYTYATPGDAADATEREETPQAQAGEGSGAPAVKIGGLKIRNGSVTIANDATGSKTQIGIPDFRLKADTLAGPFSGDGTIQYMDAELAIDGSAGGYKAGQKLPLQVRIRETDDRATLNLSGVLVTAPRYGVEGELGVMLNDPAGLLKALGMAANVPNLGEPIEIKGMLQADQTAVSLTNGKLTQGATSGALKLDAKGIDQPEKTIAATLDLSGPLDLDALTRKFEQGKKGSGKEKAPAAPEAGTKAGAQSAQSGYLPATLTLPAGLKADIRIAGPGLRYKGQNTGSFTASAGYNNGQLENRFTVASLPGGGDVSINGTLNAASATPSAAGIVLNKPALDFTIISKLPDIRAVATDWLGLVDAKLFEQGLPNRLDFDGAARLTGQTVGVSIRSLSMGPTQATGSVIYTAAARPSLAVNLNAGILQLPAPKPQAAGSDAAAGATAEKAAAREKQAFTGIDAPQLPFDLNFNIKLARLTRGDMTATDITAAGAYKGQSLALQTLDATLLGGRLTASGNIADIPDLGGLDVRAGLSTADLEGFLKAVGVTMPALGGPIGAFEGQVAAKGDRDNLNTQATVKAKGFTVTANGVLKDALSPEIPGTMAVRVQHPDFVKGVQALSPGYTGSATAHSPIDMSANVSFGGKVYSLENLKGRLGPADLAGTLKADMSGARPSITARLTSQTLALGDLMGVENNTGVARAATAGGASAAPAKAAPRSDAAPWSRDAINTGFLRAADLDVSLNAKSLSYGTWLVNDAELGVDLKNGTLKLDPFDGKLYGGSLSMDVTASSAGERQPLNVAMNGNIANVNIAGLLSSLTAQGKKLADGIASLDFSLKTSGLSSAALVGALNGQGTLKTGNLVVYGIDLDKLANSAKDIFSGGWQGALTALVDQGLMSGQTAFKDLNHNFAITEGNLPINNLTLQTKSGLADLTSAGQVSFARWQMDINSNVTLNTYKDKGSIAGIRLYGPLSNPQKAVNSQALESQINKVVGKKVEKLLGDSDNKLLQGLGGLLGGGKTQEQAPAQPQGSQQQAPTQPAPTQQQPQQQQNPQQQLLNGILNQLGR